MLKGKPGFYPESYAEVFEPLNADTDNITNPEESRMKSGINRNGKETTED